MASFAYDGYARVSFVGEIRNFLTEAKEDVVFVEKFDWMEVLIKEIFRWTNEFQLPGSPTAKPL